MRELFVFPACVILASCNPPTSDDTDAQPDAVADAAVMAADGAPPEGRYRATDAEGVVLIEELREDGTYTFSDDGGVVLEEGSYVQKSPAELCFTAGSDGAAEKCYAEEIGEDGVWRTTDPETGMVSVIERIDE